MIVLDTNVLSEILKPLPNEAVVGWIQSLGQPRLCITAVTVAEAFYGIEIMERGKRKTGLADSLAIILAKDFRDRILPFDEAAARVYATIVAGRRAVGRPMSTADAQIAAIAKSQGATLVTRNTADFELCGLKLINPWNYLEPIL